MSFDLDAALEALARRIDRIESDRVARMAELERKFAERIDTLVAGCNSHSRRLEALERNVSDETWGDGVDKRIRELEARSPVTTPVANLALTLVDLTGRIHTLERGEKELYARCQEVAGAALAALQDRDRQDRWHATRDAFVAGRGPCYARNDAEYAAYTDALHKAAKDFADRAHGPLEIVVPAGTTFDAEALALGRGKLQGVGWAAWDAKVEALVKAAEEAMGVLCHLETPNRELEAARARAIDALAHATKPFEASGGGE